MKATELLTDSNLRIGYEVEYEFNEFGDLDEYDSSDRRTINSHLKTIAKKLKKIGVKADTGKFRLNKPDVWAVHYDVTQLEIATEVHTSLKTSLKNLKKTFKLLETEKYTTTDESGLHVNISYLPNGKLTKGNPDLMKLIMFMNEYTMLKDFRRKDNYYAESIFAYKKPGEIFKTLQLKRMQKILSAKKPTIHDIGVAFRRLIKKDPDVVFDLAKTFTKSNLRVAKFSSLNLTKWYRHGYFEFRMMGNRNYHKRFKKVSANVQKLALAVKLAYDPMLHRDDYRRRLTNFFTSQFKAKPRVSRYGC